MNNSAPRSAMIDHALSLAEKGFRVFPLKPGTKIPGIKRWPELACTDTSAVEFWWRSTYAHANVGIATGEDLVIIDFDTKHGGPAIDNLKKLIAAGLPKTYTVETPSGGMHFYYLVPPGESQIRSTVGDSWGLCSRCDRGYRCKDCHLRMTGVDLRGRGGQGVGPGSVVAKYPDTPYTVKHDVPIAQLPENIYNSMPKAKPKGESPAGDSPAGEADDFSQAAEPGPSLGLLDGSTKGSAASLVTTKESEFSELPRQIPLGSHDELLFKHACSMRERGVPRGHAEIIMRELAGRCQPDPQISGAEAKALAIEKALEKLNHAWQAYEPGGTRDWVEVVTADCETIDAPARDVKSLSAALGRYVLVESGNRVVDRQRHGSHAVFALEEYKNSVKNVKLQVGEKKYPLAGLWLGHKERQTVRDTGYSPSGEEIYHWQGEGFYNTYLGPSIRTKTEALTSPDPEKMKVAIDHIKYFFPDKADATQFLMWMAFSARHPDKRIPWSPLIISKPGAGKGWLFNFMGRLLGSNNCIMIQPDAFNTNSAFNDFLSEKTLVCVDEMRTTRRFDMMEKLKSLITETELEINHKYGAKRKERIFANFLCFSNHADAAAIKDDDRRFWVYRVAADPKGSAYYSTLFDWLNTDGPAHFLKFLQQLDMSAWRYAAKPPETRARKDMIDANRSEIETLIIDAIEDRHGLFLADIVSHVWIKNWVMMELGVDRLDSKQIFHLNQAVNDCSYPIPVDRLRVSFGPATGKGHKQVRVKCIRNPGHWSTCSRETLDAELKRCWHLSVGDPDPGPSMELVEEVSG